MTIETNSMIGAMENLYPTDLSRSQKSVSAPLPQSAPPLPANSVGPAPSVDKQGGALANQGSSVDELNQAVEKINNFTQLATRDIQFSVDKDTDILLVKVVDRGTKEVIRQIPSEEIVQIAKTLDSFTGLLVKQKA